MIYKNLNYKNVHDIVFEMRSGAFFFLKGNIFHLLNSAHNTL